MDKLYKERLFIRKFSKAYMDRTLERTLCEDLYKAVELLCFADYSKEDIDELVNESFENAAKINRMAQIQACRELKQKGK